jgi:hypothetical protein
MNRVCLYICFMMMFFSGCTSYWYSPGRSFCQVKDDCVECRIEARDYDTSLNPLNGSVLKYERKCMKDKGYKLVGGGSLSEDIQKRPPDSVYGERYGIAGCYENDIHEE